MFAERAGSYRRWRFSRRRMMTNKALVAQLDRAADFESAGRRFEPCRARHLTSPARLSARQPQQARAKRAMFRAGAVIAERAKMENDL